MGPRIVLIGVINVRVRVNMQDAQFGMAPADRAHDRMGDCVVATEAYQRIARLQYIAHVPFDEVPWITLPVELNVSMILEPSIHTPNRPPIRSKKCGLRSAIGCG